MGVLLFVVVLIGGVLALVLTWQVGREREAAKRPEERQAFGGTYVEGMAGAPGRLNPLFASLNEADRTLTSLVFSGLTRLDKQGAPFPDLAETWSMSADGRVWTFRLRAGLLWHDGRPLDADDVVFTYRIVQDPTAAIAAAADGGAGGGEGLEDRRADREHRAAVALRAAACLPDAGHPAGAHAVAGAHAGPVRHAVQLPAGGQRAVPAGGADARSVRRWSRTRRTTWAGVRAAHRAAVLSR